MTRSLAIAFISFALSVSALADDFAYEARIDGMVCAFCAYNVGKTIGTMKGVDAESVSVDLEANLASFRADVAVGEAALSAAIAHSGFTLSTLRWVEVLPTQSTTSYQSNPLMELDLDGVDTKRFESILETIGEFASTQGLRLVIEAPETIEIDLLMPILMGRKPAINVHFLPVEKRTIHIRMYSESVAASQ